MQHDPDMGFPGDGEAEKKINPSGAPSPDCEKNDTSGAGAQSTADNAAAVGELRKAIDHLATLPDLEYESIRKAEAERLDIRATKLDIYVKKARKDGGYDSAQGQHIELKEQEPWAEPVNGSDLLFALVSAFKKYLILPEYGGEILALWTLHAHTYESSYHTPRLAVTAPERECGKTVLLDVLESLTPRSIRTENCTTAVLFRLIHGYRPTLLVDEFDSFLMGNEDLRGALNAGHRKGGLHMRCEGDNNEVKGFKTFAPVAIAGIGMLPATLAGRAIHISMRRARSDLENIAIFRADQTDEEDVLASKAARWAADNFDSLCNADPVLPNAFSYRSGDNWRPLLAIADLCGEGWAEIARKAARHNSGGSIEISVGEMLLEDIRDIFDEKKTDPILSSEIAEALNKMEHRPWPEWGKAKRPITTTGFARLLRPFNITPDKWREGTDTLRGYHRADFDDAFSRYLPSQPATVATALIDKENSESQPATDFSGVASGESENTNEINSVAFVAGEKGGMDKDDEVSAGEDEAETAIGWQSDL